MTAVRECVNLQVVPDLERLDGWLILVALLGILVRAAARGLQHKTAGFMPCSRPRVP